MNVYEKLLSVQSQLKAPKSQYNAFGKYNYRNCEDILEAAKPICKAVNALVYLSDEIELIGERYYVKATARFIDPESGEGVYAVAYAREEETKKGMDGSQVTGASSSYARKYALVRNPLFFSFAGIGGNCTNFVSQCVLAGSCVMNYTPIYGWYYLSTNRRSASWTGVQFFYNFMIENMSVGPFGIEVPLEGAQIGDVIQLQNEV